MGTLLHVIYVPGLADNSVRKVGQQLVMKWWQARFHVATDYYDVHWSSGTFNDKLAGLIALIDQWAAKGQTIALVASSAGSSLALQAFVVRREAVGAFVTISGALGPSSDAQAHYLMDNPPLKASLDRNAQALQSLSTADRARVLVVKPAADGVVALHNMDVNGAERLHLPTRQHMWTIAAALTIYSATIMAFIRRATS